MARSPTSDPLVGGQRSARCLLYRPSRTMLPPTVAMARCSSAATRLVHGGGMGRRAEERDLDAGVRARSVRERPAQAGLRGGRRIDRSRGEKDGGQERDHPRSRDDRPIGAGPMQAHPPPRKQ